MSYMRVIRMSSPVHRHVIYFAQFINAVDVVMMAMSTQDGIETQLVRLQEIQHWRSLARIDCNGMAFMLKQPDIVILQGRDGIDDQHGRNEDWMPNCKISAQSLSEWFAGDQGSYVLMRERQYFDHTVSDIFGYNAVQLGLPEHDFLNTSRIPLRFSAGAQNGNTVRMCCDELPFDSDSLDLVLMPHVLEFADNPHQILREVERVLRPEGNLVISGFNPFSLWGLHRALGRKHGYPWCGHFVRLPRLKDWLALLGFEVAGGRFAAYAPPLHHTKWLERFSFMEKAGDRWWAVSGGVYFLHAIKRVPGMRLIKPQWNKGLVSKLLPAAPKLNNRITQKTNDKNE
jgi:SAM-dependent methyltransferase